MTVDLERLEQLMGRMRVLGIDELLYEHVDERIHLVAATQPASSETLHAKAPPTTAAATPTPTVQAEETIDASMYGVFYAAPTPDAPPFVAPDDEIAAGAPLCILEVMKTLSRIDATFRCRVVSVLARNAQYVEPGMPLFVVERLDA